MPDVTKKCFRCSKVLLYIINILFWMLGAALLGLGIWLHFTNDALLSVAPGFRLFMPAALFILPGCLSIIVGFFGCCGAVMENKCMVISYCVLSILVLIMEFSVAIVTLSGDLHVTVHREIEDRLNLSISERYPTGATDKSYEREMMRGWDILQQEFKCCGVVGYTDWYKSHGWPMQDKVPDSCCQQQYVGCGEETDIHNIYTQGCSRSTQEFILKHLTTVAVITLIFAGLQMATIVGAVIFTYYHRKHKELQ
ncbi:tetraspanin-9-like [Watersipora subatra]|uniref:tetraspanin-9-like n=1 Tax=Watersipora subatra TaxID=2589382 RepID=UPI00355C32CE